ncbi:osteopetrosis-associated transmembrane protein 1 isoform 2-T2 [Synchiropus picturatus]
MGSPGYHLNQERDFFLLKMLSLKSVAVLLGIVLNCVAVVAGEGLNGSVSDLKQEETPSPAVGSPLFKPAPRSLSLNLLSFPEDVEMSDYCHQLLQIFGERYVSAVTCLVPAARPVLVCQKCYPSFRSLVDTYANISSDQGVAGNESCRDSLIRSDRLMLVYMLYSSLDNIWTKSDCDNCLTEGLHSLTNDTLDFIALHNQTISCFELNRQNHSELCINCNNTYKRLNDLYSRMEKDHTLCIDIEDAMNVTRRMWSKVFSCSFPLEETVPVIAVSSFMLFLPIIFYLSSFLHSEQKKRKLIHPKRAQSQSSLMNIQDKQS